MSFNELRREVFRANVLDSEFFAEAVTITEPGSSARTVTVKITEDQHAENESLMGSEQEVERIVVACLRDRTDATYGGIDDPLIGRTQLVREKAEDPDPRPYVYQGEQRSRNHYRWKLVFERRRQTAQGAGR